MMLCAPARGGERLERYAERQGSLEILYAQNIIRRLQQGGHVFARDFAHRVLAGRGKRNAARKLLPDLFREGGGEKKTRRLPESGRAAVFAAKADPAASQL